jgi:Mg2+/Co2+ transporter CorB
MEFLNTIDWSFWGPLVAIFILICLSGFFSGSETALTAVSKARMLVLEKEGNKRAKIVNVLIERKDKLIGALLLGNNLVNILASAIATAFFINLVGESGVVYATLVMTVVVLIFAEVLPKTYALTHSDKVALAIAPLIRCVVNVFSPVTFLISKIVNIALKMVGGEPDDVNMADMAVQELRGAIDLAHDSDDNDDKESSEKRAMLRSILDLVDVDVEDVMTHRSNVTTLNIESSIEQIVDDVLDSPYTRIPVWKNDKDNIIGIIHAKILLKELRHIGGSVEKLSIDSILMEPWFVPETTTLFDQLQAFRERKEHFAIVVDEYGAFQGIVTLEDVLEEIVGEIDDEQDLETTGIHVQDDGSYLVEGTLTVRDLNRELDWNLPDEDYTTIAGLIIYESKMVPDVGQSFLFYGYRFQIMQRERNQITSLKITAPKRQND